MAYAFQGPFTVSKKCSKRNEINNNKQTVKVYNGSYEKKMMEKKVIGKFWENFLQKRSDLLQKVTY